MAPVGPLLEMLFVVYHKALFYAHYFFSPSMLMPRLRLCSQWKKFQE